MKICLINNLYAPWERGGAEKIVARAAKGLEQAGHDVFVIATAPEETKSENVYFLKSIFYNLSSYPLWQRLLWHIGDFFNPSHLRKIKEILKNEKPDLVITHNLKGVSLALPRLLKKMSIRHFHTLHDIQLLHPSGLMYWKKESLINSFPAKAYQFFSRRLFASPEVVISPSHWLLSEHLTRGFFSQSKKIVLPNFFHDSREVSRLPKNYDKFVFLFVGQLEKHKGVDFLLDCFLSLLEKNPDARAELRVVGEGSLLKELKIIATGHPEIKMIGHLPSEEIRDLMLEADCLVVPSLCYENSPTVIYEAAAAELPVLASNLGGISELIEATGGWLFEPGSGSEFLVKMEHLVSFPQELEMARKKEKQFSPADYLSELENLAERKNKG